MSGRTRAEQGRRRQHQQRLVVTAVVVLLVAVLGLVLAWSGDTSEPGVEVSLTEYAFAPSPIEATDRRIDVTNDGAIAHNLVIPELGKGTVELASGESQVIDLSGQPAGTYRVICDLSDHLERGMETTLVLR